MAYFVPLKIPFSLSSLLIRLPESRRCVPKSRLQWKLRISIWRKSRISACCVFGARAEGFCSFGASGSYVGIPSSVIVEFPCQSGLWHPTLRKRETYKFPKQRDRTKRPCGAHRPAVRMAHSLLKGEKLNKSKIASEMSTLWGKSSKKECKAEKGLSQ